MLARLFRPTWLIGTVAGNLNWLAERTGTEVYVPQATAEPLTKVFQLPWARRFIIGSPPPLRAPYQILEHKLRTKTGSLEVYAAPGQEKLQYLKWLRQQIDAGLSEGLSICAVEATCFPWGPPTGMGSFINDQLMRFFSLGHWSRIELVRSFVRLSESDSVLPLVY